MSQLEPIVSGPTPAPAAELPDYVRVLLAAADYLPADQRDTLVRAWRVGADAHAGQMRKSGEPYITHPVAAATPQASTASRIVLDRLMCVAASSEAFGSA